MKQHSVLSNLIVSGSAWFIGSASSFASPPIPPQFDSPSYSVLVDVSEPGLQSFEIRGTATDPHPNDTLQIYLSGPSPWNYFSSVSGNPASFIFGANDLGYVHRGLYVFGVTAIDNSPFQSFTGTTITVRIVPEPITASCLLFGVAALSRHRRGHSRA
jgi:hypothetical protein